MLNMKARIVILAIGGIVLTALVLVGVLVLQQAKLKSNLESELMALAREQTASSAKDVWLMCRVADSTQEAQAGKLSAVTDELAGLGSVDNRGTETQWTASNQLTADKWTLSLPGLRFGGQPLSPGVLDRLAAKYGCDIIVYQRMSEAGELLRTATTYQREDGSRFTGSYIPAMDHQSGVQHPLVGALLRNEQHFGSSIILGSRTSYGFRPLVNSAGEPIGGVQVLLHEPALDELRNGIMDIIVGKTGYAFVIDSEGNYVISKNGASDGKNLWEAKDCDGVLFIQEMIEKAKRSTDGEVDFHRYPWMNEAEPRPRYKIVAVTYYEPWDWIIGAGCYEDDYHHTLDMVNGELWNMVQRILIYGLVILVIATILAFAVASRIEKETFVQ